MGWNKKLRIEITQFLFVQASGFPLHKQFIIKRSLAFGLASFQPELERRLESFDIFINKLIMEDHHIKR